VTRRPRTAIGAGRGTLAEINVTPMVDVMLVLLVIFMIAAPMTTMGLDLTLPRMESADLIEEPRLVVSVRAGGELYLAGEAVVPGTGQTPLDRLLELVAERLRAGEGPDLFLEGDARVPYGTVLEVMDALRVAREAATGSALGDLRVALVTSPRREDRRQ
jgi:biopolymer transport protein TolR